MNDNKFAEATKTAREISRQTAEDILLDVAIEILKERIEVEKNFNTILTEELNDKSS